jgi:hypothetical protein
LSIQANARPLVVFLALTYQHSPPLVALQQERQFVTHSCVPIVVILFAAMQHRSRFSMLVTLSMVFCLIADPTQCHTVTPLIPDDQFLTMSNCPMAGQTEGARWVDEHPLYRMTRGAMAETG